MSRGVSSGTCLKYKKTFFLTAKLRPHSLRSLQRCQGPLSWISGEGRGVREERERGGGIGQCHGPIM